MSKRKEPDTPKNPAYLFIVSCGVCNKDESTLIYKHHLHKESILLLSEYPWDSEEGDTCSSEMLELLFHLGHTCVVKLESETKILSQKFVFHRFASDSTMRTHSSNTIFDVTNVSKLKIRHIHLNCDDKDVLLEEAKFCLKVE